MVWEFREGVPIYQQIVQGMQIRIANGTYSPGEKVPAVRELALQAGVNPNTMQRALAELERDGYLRSERTSGRYVTVDQERLASLRKELGDMFIKEMVEKMRELGMDHSQIVEAVIAWKESK